ncbi:uncharacterized protein LOC128961108 [Oppia nitens]|uniref:uncharacterized protein LOC128961108 n=1 Tax=Oppia nitens TaxID=1686743 RepID=UPI0023DB5541|nr:uncharacterized protein LOC128961108 [Oppia nitens]
MIEYYFLRAFCFALLGVTLVWTQRPPQTVNTNNNNNNANIDYDDDISGIQAPGSRDVPVFVNVYTHPKTKFTCADKQAGQYYADPETKCAVYYVCIANERGGLSPQSFACPNGTIFSQSTRVCASHEQVYCQLSERFYDAVHGNIDSKGQEEHYRPTPLQPWRKQQQNVRPAQPPPPAHPSPPQAAPQPQSRSPAPQVRPQIQRDRLQPIRPAIQATPNAAPAAPTSLTSRRSQFVPQPQQPVAAPVTPAPAAPQPHSPAQPAAAPVEYEYEYVDYPLPNETLPALNRPVSGVQPAAGAAGAARSKRDTTSPARRKGQLPSPFDFLSASHIITSFNCEDKVPGIAYADPEADCRMFHVCIPLTKGKLKDYQLYCDPNKAFNQQTGSCQPLEGVKCHKSHKFYVYNKWFRPHESRKDSWRHIKKNAIKIKS